MGDRSAKGPCCGSLDVEVNPLVITCCVGEELHLGLFDPVITRVSEVFADVLFDVCEGKAHVPKVLGTAKKPLVAPIA
jgi:hypothetical protein